MADRVPIPDECAASSARTVRVRRAAPFRQNERLQNMEAASRPEFEPLTEAGPEMPAAPAPLPPPAVNRLLEQASPLEMAAGPASVGTPSAGAPAAATASAAAPPNMDRDFIARNQIVERYLSGKLPIKGATDFERFCKANPELLDTLGLPERV